MYSSYLVRGIAAESQVQWEGGELVGQHQNGVCGVLQREGGGWLFACHQLQPGPGDIQPYDIQEKSLR